MGRINIPYYVVKKGNGYWQPTAKMRAAGFESIRCGKDGPKAWETAEQWNERWQRHRRGLEQHQASRYPTGSFGDIFERYKRTNEWEEKKPRTREEWERGFKLIAEYFGDVPPTDPEVTLENVSNMRREIARSISPREAWRAIKIWRALWNVCASFGVTGGRTDPAKGIRNKQPPARSDRWYEGEVSRLVKQAWRDGYFGLAAAIACVWDTMMSPVDVRLLTVEQRKRDAEGTYFEVRRAKSSAAVIGTIGKRAETVLNAYLAKHPVEVGAIFRNRSGSHYSQYTLPDDFAAVRAKVFPGDKRTLADMRRSGAMEARAGSVDPATLSAKMANSISTSNALHKAYQPVDITAVREADEARKRGRALTKAVPTSAQKAHADTGKK